MYSAFAHGGPMRGGTIIGPETAGGEHSPKNFIVRPVDDPEWPEPQYRYACSEIWVGEGEGREFRGWRFDLESPEGEEIKDLPEYELRQIGE